MRSSLSKRVAHFFFDMPLFATHEIPPNGKFPKLMRTLEDKKEYVIHYKALQQAISLGVEVKKIHRILKFKQKRYLGRYVMLNSRLRKKATSKFEKNLRKAQNNIIFGVSFSCFL